MSSEPPVPAASRSRVLAVLDQAIEPIAIARPVLDGNRLVDLEVTFTNAAARAWSVTLGSPISVGVRLAGASRFAQYVEAYATGQPLELTGVPAVTRTDEQRTIDIRVVRVDQDMVFSWRDVTARHAADQALADSEARFRTAFDDAPVGMLIVSLEEENKAQYLQVNQAFARLVGTEPQALVGTRGIDLVHPDEREVDALLLGELVSGARTLYQREKRLHRVDGSWVWVRMTASAVRHPGVPAYALVHVEDVTARRAAEAELARRALVDPLTGLANRSVLLDHLHLAARELDRTGGALAVLYLDLDRFKDVNDTLGHAAGDEVLRQVAGRLTATVRAGEVAGRLAGDEFLVAAHVPDDADAVAIAERLYQAVAAPIQLGHRSVVVRPSIGVTLTTAPTTTAEDLVRQADLAMYQAKRGGRQPWALYDEPLHRLALERLEVEEILRTAVDQDRLRLLYQPIVDVAGGRVVAVEALLRLDHPARGLLEPAAFIEVAEDSDLIVPIGEWVFAESCRQLARWQRSSPQMHVSVNVSARQVQHLAVRDQVLAATSAAGTSPQSLHLEITERVLLGAGEEVLAELRGITRAGCGLAIDDFGTGYSSLAYLTRFPVTALKIDRSFVAGLGSRDEDTAVVEAVIGLARALDLATVAEGVETADQLTRLRAMGCDQAQGFHLGRPMNAEAVAELLES